MKLVCIIQHRKLIKLLRTRYERDHAGDKEFQCFPGFFPRKKTISEGARKRFKGLEDGGGTVDIRGALTGSRCDFYLYFIFPGNNILHLQSGFFHEFGKSCVKAQYSV